MLNEPRPCRLPVVGDDQIEALIIATSWLAGKAYLLAVLELRRGRVGD